MHLEGTVEDVRVDKLSVSFDPDLGDAVAHAELDLPTAAESGPVP